MKEIHTPLGPCVALTVPVLSTVHITEGDRLPTPQNVGGYYSTSYVHAHDSPWLRHILRELRKAGFEYVRFDPEATPTPGLPNLSDL